MGHSSNFLTVIRYLSKHPIVKTSLTGVEIIMHHEGLRTKAYKDIVGVWTIGYGHTSTASEFMEVSNSQAIALLKQDIRYSERAVNKYVVSQGCYLNPNQFDALVSLVFNIGAGSLFTKNYNNGFPRGSRLYNYLLKGDYALAAKQFTAFCKAGGKVVPGLLSRRESEKELFLKPSY